jgi:hypothetical protein
MQTISNNGNVAEVREREELKSQIKELKATQYYIAMMSDMDIVDEEEEQ